MRKDFTVVLYYFITCCVLFLCLALIFVTRYVQYGAIETRRKRKSSLWDFYIVNSRNFEVDFETSSREDVEIRGCNL